MPAASHAADSDRRAREDAVPVGNTRPAKLLGLPYPLSVALCIIAYAVQTNVTGWQGIVWAAAVVGPLWIPAMVVVARDPYGVNVVVAYLRCCVMMRDKRAWGGPSLSPLPAVQQSRPRRQSDA